MPSFHNFPPYSGNLGFVKGNFWFFWVVVDLVGVSWWWWWRWWWSTRQARDVQMISAFAHGHLHSACHPHPLRTLLHVPSTVQWEWEGGTQTRPDLVAWTRCSLVVHHHHHRLHLHPYTHPPPAPLHLAIAPQALTKKFPHEHHTLHVSPNMG